MKKSSRRRGVLPGQSSLFGPGEPDPPRRGTPRPSQRKAPVLSTETPARRQRGPLDPLHHRARKARDEALERVEGHADPGWQVRALDALRRTAEAKAEFISDDVWKVAELPETRDNRALGPIFRDAIRKGWIRKTYQLRPSVRSHLSGKPVWESLIFKGERP